MLHQLGDRLQRLRKERGLGTVALAEQVGVSRPTLRAVESGDPNTSIGIYLRVMSALGVGGELAMLASNAMGPAASGSAAARSRRPRPAVHVTVSADPDASETHDLQSLALHAAAVRLIRQDDQLRLRARATVQGWLRQDPASRSTALWREWEQILDKGSFRRVLGRSVHAQQLRQASPLPTILPADVRKALLDEVRQLKQGLVLGGQVEAPAP
ncbi:MAG: helix-turn-helix domain-containing protein [Hylemonella sp.]|nr:helix-turn-helix domain-containing protein [Hylemonella sp.]